MKKTDLIKKLSDMTQTPADKLMEIFTSDKEELEIDLPVLHVYSDEELESLKINLNKATSKTAVEMAVKQARNKLVEQYGDEYNFTEKTPETLMEFALKAGEKKAGVKPNEQIQEKDKIINTLQQNLKTLEAEKLQVLNEKNQVLMDIEYQSTISRNIPKEFESIYSPADLTVLAKNARQITVEDGRKVVKDENGVVMRDAKTQEPLSVDAAISTWIKEKGIVRQPTQGRGEGDKGTNHTHSEFKSVQEIADYVEENKLTNEKAQELTRKFFKDNPNSGM